MKRVIIPFVFIFLISIVYAQASGGGGGPSYTIESCESQGYITSEECGSIIDRASINRASIETEDKKKQQYFLVIAIGVFVGVYYLKRKDRNVKRFNSMMDKPLIESPPNREMELRKTLYQEEQTEKVNKLEKEVKEMKKEKVDDKYFE